VLLSLIGPSRPTDGDCAVVQQYTARHNLVTIYILMAAQLSLTGLPQTMTLDPLSEQHVKGVWNVFGRALGAEPRDGVSIRGASGLDHLVEAISVDDKNRRVIIFAAESNPRIAALMQVDIQATIPEARVLIARPIAFDAGSFARRFAEQIGQTEINLKTVAEIVKEIPGQVKAGDFHPEISDLIAPFVAAVTKVKLPPLNQILAFVQQAALVDWSAVKVPLVIPLANLLTLDSMEADRRFGICPIPLYEFTEQDWELLLSGTALMDIAERLKALGIYQYFFPPPDQITLGMVERGDASVRTISSALDIAPEIGHPLGTSELVRAQAAVPELVEQLTDCGLLVEGEMGLEITETGAQARTTVKFRPREGFLSKLIQRFTVNANVSVSPKDFIQPH
jgi:hypothetical protein